MKELIEKECTECGDIFSVAKGNSKTKRCEECRLLASGKITMNYYTGYVTIENNIVGKGTRVFTLDQLNECLEKVIK